MREFFDDVYDIELDDNEIIDRLMREWEMEERRQMSGTRRVPARTPAAALHADEEDDLDDDLDDDFDDESESYEDYDDDY